MWLALKKAKETQAVVTASQCLDQVQDCLNYSAQVALSSATTYFKQGYRDPEVSTRTTHDSQPEKYQPREKRDIMADFQ